jgi:hypothetical protein
VVANNDINRLIPQRNVLHVEVEVGKWRLEIGSDIVLIIAVVALKVAHKRYLGGDV